jgi:CheY-like chemotaxis protein
MVYGFVKLSGGHVKVYSEPGRGTVVRLYFPLHEGPDPDRPAADPAAGVERGAGEIILVVEDEPGVRKLAALILGALGYRVIVAEDGPAALSLARQEPRIDLLFTDVMLPGGMHGRQLAEELARQRPALAVLYTSGYSADIVEHRGQVEPGLRMVEKPYSREALARAVRAALKDRR